MGNSGTRLPESIDRNAFAAWYAVCAALLNLDETAVTDAITRM